MPNGVVVFDTRTNEVIFENEKLETMLRSREIRNTYDTRLRAYA